MIELYRLGDCPTCDDIEAALVELVVAHQVIVLEPGQGPAGLPADTPLPAIRDNGRLIYEAAITGYLRELAKFVEEWRMFQADACYLDPATGETC